MHDQAQVLPHSPPEVPHLTPSQASLSTRYRELQSELVNLVAQEGGIHPREERIRHAREGSIKLYDAIILAQLLEEQRPARILEIGSFLGFSTRWFLEISRSSEVVSIDPGIRHRVFDQPADVLCQFNAGFLDSRLIQKCGFFCQKLSGNSYYDYEHHAPILPRPEVDRIMQSRPLLHSGNLGEGTFDFIFIDGDHSEAATACSFHEALPLLNPHGRIAFHDAITWPDVARVLDHIAGIYSHLGEVRILGSDFLQTGPIGCCDGIGVFQRR